MDGPPAAVEERELRDSFGEFENVVTSEHFAVKWGDAITPDAEDVTLLLEALELAWTVEMEELGFPPPTGIDEHYLNVYVANSGGHAPTLDFNGAYTNEADGFAYIVVSPEIVRLFSGDDPLGISFGDPHAYATEYVAHELLHTSQYATNAFEDDAWIWEASASWAGDLVSPDGRLAQWTTASYWVTPFLPVPDFGSKGGVPRHYGAWCFWYYVDAVLDERTLVRDVWTSASPDDDALEATKAELEARGHDWSELFLDFALRNAVYDYEWATFPVYDLETNPLMWGGRRIAATWDDAGTGGLQRVDPAWGLHRASYNVIELWDPDSNRWDVTVVSDDDALVATIAITDRDGYRTVPLPDREATIETMDSDLSIFLVIAQPSLEGGDETVIDYEYSIDPASDVETPDPSGPSDSPDEQGCGCGGGGRASPLTVLLLALCARRRSP
jgi:hypothetical protein